MTYENHYHLPSHTIIKRDMTVKEPEERSRSNIRNGIPAEHSSCHRSACDSGKSTTFSQGTAGIVPIFPYSRVLNPNSNTDSLAICLVWERLEAPRCTRPHPSLAPKGQTPRHIGPALHIPRDRACTRDRTDNFLGRKATRPTQACPSQACDSSLAVSGFRSQMWL